MQLVKGAKAEDEAGTLKIQYHVNTDSDTIHVLELYHVQLRNRSSIFRVPWQDVGLCTLDNAFKRAMRFARCVPELVVLVTGELSLFVVDRRLLNESWYSWHRHGRCFTTQVR